MNLAIIQARLGSSRFPRKVLSMMGGETLLQRVYRRVQLTSSVDEIVVAIPDSRSDDELFEYCMGQGLNVARGSESDVLSRFSTVIEKRKPRNVLRITSDCPLVDPQLIDEAFSSFVNRGFDYFAIAAGAGVSKSLEPRFPDGLDAEWISAAVLLIANDEATTELEREHVTPFIWQRKERFVQGNLRPHKDLGQWRFTIDLPSDLESFDRLQKVFEDRFAEISFHDVLQHVSSNHEFSLMFTSQLDYDELHE